MSNFRYAICNETFKDWAFDKAFAYARQLGYQGIEIAPFTLNPDARQVTEAQVQEVLSLAAENDLEIVGLHWLLAFTEGFYLTSPDEGVQSATVDYLRELSGLCRRLGGRYMVLGSPLQRNLLPGVSEAQAMEIAASVLRRVCDTLQEDNVILAVEPLGPEEGDFLLTAEAGRQLVASVDSPNCKLHLDVKAMSSESKSIETIIRESVEDMVHFHANDPNKRGPGMGDQDFVPILQTLNEVGYSGWVSVEVFDYAPGVEALASESLAYLKQCELQID